MWLTKILHRADQALAVIRFGSCMVAAFLFLFELMPHAGG